ncbi:MarR family winged helix-turn-helix transcriptional regulator [Brevibacterium aurantiacum]|uniref:MarR family winged helix-turn-helix transcriptional regulator n=1 Tax=Brevibacterium aurantiacum TaxID=273384 RepID=UPI0018686A68|nr:MarR family transcriptional regulator [Brevibacterium aurantiacum]
MEDLSLATLIWLRMARFVQNSNQLSNDHLRQFGLTVAQFEALAHIRNFQPITQTDLARGLTVTGGGISRMLSRLEAEGLIARTQDWKTKHITLTDKGAELLERAFPSQLQQQASLFDEALDEEEKTQLHALMKKLYDNSRRRQDGEDRA